MRSRRWFPRDPQLEAAVFPLSFRQLGRKMQMLALPEFEVVYAVKPGDGLRTSSRQLPESPWWPGKEQYATKRYRSNVINWGMLH
jgi:hypothetical protein